VTGAGGGVGRAFLSQVPGHHDVDGFDHESLDVGDHEAVQKALVPLAAEVILNFAAFTKVDVCESEPDRAYRDNALAAQNVALAARRAGSALVQVSTDYVFEGEKGSPYDELDDPAPLSVYGRSKLAAEHFVRRIMPEHFIVRTGYVFGGGAEYLTSALRLLARGGATGGLADRRGSPTYVHDLAARVLPLVMTGRFGTYHLAGPEPTTWFDVLQRAKRIGRLPGDVIPQRAAELALPAARPRDSSLVSLFTDEVGLDPMRPLDDALGDLLGRLEQESSG
jgi:dTDP-4-dehydrorhamnose reductase